MRSSDFGPIVSPLILARETRRAKGGAAKKPKKHILLILMPMLQPGGVLARTKGRRHR